MESAIEGFGQLVERAYFDYQRDKVYVRTNPRIKRIQRDRRRNVQYVVNATRVHEYDVCPHCLARNVEIIGQGQVQSGFVTELTDPQRRILKLLGIPDTEFRS